MLARIFNIQRFSVNDGPGIRTIVFFKGCPLRCDWCSNPESQESVRQLLRDKKKCVGCNKCEDECPTGAISFSSKGTMVHDPSLCIKCGQCVEWCPTRALEFTGEFKSVEAIMAEVMKDKAFYDRSGGGLTCSGGEVLCQPEVARHLLDAAHGEGISTAIETSGYSSEATFRRVAEAADTLMLDVKLPCDAAYRKFTGVGSGLIMRNLRWASENHPGLVVRIPVIPGVNDSLGDAAAFGHLLRDAGARRVNILPFHQFGEGKYEELGIPYAMSGLSALHEEDLDGYRKIMERYGLEVFF